MHASRALLRWVRTLLLNQPDLIEQFQCQFASSSFILSKNPLRSAHDVLQDCHMRKQIELLKNHADPLARLGFFPCVPAAPLPIKLSRASQLRSPNLAVGPTPLLEQVAGAQYGVFPRPALAEQNGGLPLRNFE